MDHDSKHYEGVGTAILDDLRNCQSALDLLLVAGKASELSLGELIEKPNDLLIINSVELPNRMAAEMIRKAREAREGSYAPYSNFNVGAAILAENNVGEKRIIGGCNVENASYGATICAERCATFKAVSEGFRKFLAYAVVGGFDFHKPKKMREAAQKSWITPCGPCRQVTNEFENYPCAVLIARDTGEVLTTTLDFILPSGFGPRALGVDACSYARHKTA